MLKRLLQLLLLISAMVVSGCAATGPAARPSECPRLPPLPSNLMQPPETEKRVRAELFEQQLSATLRFEDYKRC